MTSDINSRYGLNPAHSEVVEACKIIAPCSALDMGCSNGRNAIYMGQLGFDVTAVDKNPGAIDALKQVVTRLLTDHDHRREGCGYGSTDRAAFSRISWPAIQAGVDNAARPDRYLGEERGRVGGAFAHLVR